MLMAYSPNRSMEFVKESVIKAPRGKVFAFHELPDAVERLIPPWENIEVVQKADISTIGSRAIFKQKFLGFTVSTWVAEHTKYDPPKMFEDVQISGPFAFWRHKHIFETVDEGTLLRDKIEYRLRFAYMGMTMAPLVVLPKLEKMFEYRHRVTKEWCEKK